MNRLIGLNRYRVGLRTDFVGLRVGLHLFFWRRGPRFRRNYYKRDF